MTHECSEAWAYEKAQAWADTMGRAEKVVEFKRGKFDCLPHDYLTNARVVCFVQPRLALDQRA